VLQVSSVSVGSPVCILSTRLFSPDVSILFGDVSMFATILRKNYTPLEASHLKQLALVHSRDFGALLFGALFKVRVKVVIRGTLIKMPLIYV
jgi:hypothetical protein